MMVAATLETSLLLGCGGDESVGTVSVHHGSADGGFRDAASTQGSAGSGGQSQGGSSGVVASGGATTSDVPVAQAGSRIEQEGHGGCPRIT